MLVRGYSRDEGSSNGSGKSSLARRAIIWAMFGVTPEGIKADGVINRHSKGPSGATLVFEGIDGKKYTIHRARKPKPSLRFLQGGNELTLRNEKETQKLINQALGRDATGFLQTNFFGQGADKLYLDMTPKYQKEVIESILPIGYLDDMIELAKTEKVLVSQAASSLTEVTNRLNGQVTQATSNVDTLSQNSRAWSAEHRARLTEARKKVDEAKAKGDTARVEEIKAELEKMPEIAHKIDYLTQRMGSLTVEVTELGNLLSRNRDRKSQWVGHKQHLEGQRVDLKPGVCPTCSQTIDDETHAGLKAKQAELIEQVAKADEMISQCTANINLHNTAFHNKQADLYHVTDEKAKMEGMERTRRKLQDTLVTLESNEDYTKAVSELNMVRGEENPFDKMIPQQEQVLRDLNSKRDEKVEALSRLVAEKHVLDYWVTAFSKDMRNYLFAKACPFLESRTNFHLQGLGNPQIKVKFSTSKTLKSKEEREDFNIQVWSETGGGDFSSLSGGEQQITSFAVGLALADLAETQVEGKSHFLILDEPFIALDSRNYENIVQYLSELRKHKETILLISNDDSLISLIPDQINVIKSNGVSTIE